MNVKSLHIKAFGKFKDFQLNLKDGLNLVVGPNESGKTTIYHFIKACLGAGKLNVLERYKPWTGEEIDGTLVITDGDTKSIRLTNNGPTVEVLEQDLVEGLMTLSDEEDVFDLTMADQKIVARMRNKMLKAEQAEKILAWLEDLPKLETCLVEKQKELGQRIEDLKKELNTFEKIRTQLFEQESIKKQTKKRLENLFGEKSKIAGKISQLEKEISDEIEKIKSQTLREISNLNLQLKQLSLLPVVSAEEFVRLNQIHQRIKALEERIKELEEKIKANEAKFEELTRKVNELRQILKGEDLDKFKLKLKNLELSYTLVESKLDQIKSHQQAFQKSWRVFERRDFDINNFLKQNTVLSFEKLKAQINDKMNELEKELSKYEKSRSKALFLVLLSMVGTVICALLGFKISSFWYYLSIVFGLITGFLFVFYKKREKRYDEISDEKIKLQIELRNLERQVAQNKLPADFGFSDLEDLRKAYEQYLEWLKQKEDLERVKEQVEKQVKEILSQLEDYGAKALQDVPSVLMWLNQIVVDLEKAEYERLLLEKIVQQDLKTKEQVEQELAQLSKLFKSELANFGLNDPSQLSEALNRGSMILKIKEQINYLERILDLCENNKLEELAKIYPNLTKLVQEKSKHQSAVEQISKEVEQLSKQLEQQAKIEQVSLPNVEKVIFELSFNDLLKKAYEALEKSIPELRSVLTKRLEQLTGSYVDKFQVVLKQLFKVFSELAEDLTVDKDLSVKFFVASKQRNLELVLSKGTVDQLALCYKMALYEVLEPEESLPLILDNFLIRFDEERLKEAVRLLKKASEKRQVIILTSDLRLANMFEIEPVAILKKP
ncbi:ATP-binding protein [Pseudothermotoga thermarum]|uniref:Endonuclease GajA/Old nuclease/RecF-like AAA domain-containing protein n=1 Tax=Pseudothermotoga thermarum DSM 5069 TaxID=688269 RepID=F7YX23_9THEM|nr:AAA family ATPase [Pseudothermotoga thermarum]AEH50607.1 hypothetical protein Theth_0518 [Pseudothermotoga thermarum DSM 5069]